MKVRNGWIVFLSFLLLCLFNVASAWANPPAVLFVLSGVIEIWHGSGGDESRPDKTIDLEYDGPTWSIDKVLTETSNNTATFHATATAANGALDLLMEFNASPVNFDSRLDNILEVHNHNKNIDHIDEDPYLYVYVRADNFPEPPSFSLHRDISGSASIQAPDFRGEVGSDGSFVCEWGASPLPLTDFGCATGIFNDHGDVIWDFFNGGPKSASFSDTETLTQVPRPLSNFRISQGAFYCLVYCRKLLGGAYAGSQSSQHISISVNGAQLPDKAAVAMVSAQMTSDHELGVKVNTSGYTGTRPVSISSTINGQYVQSDLQHLPPGDNTIVLDFKKAGVPRFTSNQTFSMQANLYRNDGSLQSDSRTVAILLPIVIIPGISSTRPFNHAGDGEFPILETFLEDQSQDLISNDPADNAPYLGEGYRLRGDFPDASSGYPTLYTLNYPRNNATLAQSSQIMTDFMENTVRTQTWADKIYLVTHSKGGPVSRKYIQASTGNTRVKELISAQPVNYGSMWGLVGAGLGYNYQNLFPLWPYWAKNSMLLYGPPTGSVNPELRALNGMFTGPLALQNDNPFPVDIPYTII